LRVRIPLATPLFLLKTNPPLLLNFPANRHKKAALNRVDSNTVICYLTFVTYEYSLEELAEAVRSWCDKHNVVPANGQAADEITERTIRYYRTLGLLDPPSGAYIKKFNDKHRLQLIAIRLYQAQGLPLRKIRDELYGRSLADLAALEKQGVRKAETPIGSFTAPVNQENWAVIPVTGDFLLVSRHNRPLPRAVVEKIAAILSAFDPDAATKNDVTRN
jgi:DNA-binding transcriptional MerR regulator